MKLPSIIKKKLKIQLIIILDQEEIIIKIQGPEMEITEAETAQDQAQATSMVLVMGTVAVMTSITRQLERTKAST